jgi:outer membrane protein assembly factor BamB
MNEIQKTETRNSGHQKKVRSCIIFSLSSASIFFQIFFHVTAVFSQTISDYDRNWPQWRGPNMNGVSPYGDPPVKWDEKTNIKWKIPIPGLGHATPSVWGDRIFVLTAVPASANRSDRSGSTDFWDRVGSQGAFSYEVLAINRNDGSIVWKKTARVEAPHEGRHETASWASCSPMTNGKVVVAPFGSRGIYCYDMNGNLKWEKDFGDMRIRFSWGEGSSPSISGDNLIIQWDHEGRSFLSVHDINTGKEKWRVDRSYGTSWATPVTVDHKGKKQVVVTAISRSSAYDLETGRTLWETRGMTANPIPSPVSANGIVYLMGGYQETVLQAIDLEKARGSVYSSDAILWEYNQDTPYVPSPLLYNNALYFLSNNRNILTCLNAKTGVPYYTRQRLQGLTGIYASPVGAAGRVYIAGRNGVVAVLRHGPKLEVLATNKLDDNFDASPVVVGKELFLRGHDYLYCISD